MKKNLQIALLISFLGTILGCKKSNDEVIFDGGTVNVTNAVIGSPTLTMMTPNSVVSNTNTINSNSTTIMPVASGQTPVIFGIPAVAATPTNPAIPTVTYFTTTLAVDQTTNYSLFLTGTSTAAIDNVLVKESYTHTYADSLCGVRFINLAPGSNPISINIKGSSNGSEVNSLAYKAYSGFKQYPAKSVNKTLLFEIRDATTGVLLYPTNGNGYSLNVPYFHNVTIAYRGTGSNVGIIVDNDF